MNNPSMFIDSLWGENNNLKSLYESLKTHTGGRSAVISGMIGRELLLRKQALATPEFSMAAYLASEGEAGNDRLVDFIDCVTILPFSRYSKIVRNHDALIDDVVRLEFDEFGFYNIFAKRFEDVFGEEGDGLLQHLVLGDSTAKAKESKNLDPEALFPRLFKRFGSVLERREVSNFSDEKVTLDDFFKE